MKEFAYQLKYGTVLWNHVDILQHKCCTIT